MSTVLRAATLGTALGCGLMGGVFFAFSSFVMPALERLPAAQGIAAMQAINEKAESTVFLPAFMGTTLACVGLGVAAVVTWGEPQAPWLLAGGATFLVGTFLLTVACNVPLNDELASVSPHAAEAVEHWSRYVRDWTAWNHVRALTSLGAAGLLAVALRAA